MAIGLWSSESAVERLRIEGNADPAGEIWRGFPLAQKPTVLILGRSPEDLLPPAAGGEVEGGDAAADAWHKAGQDKAERSGAET
ncbi:hypothetical protein DMY87_09105 [Rhizobium wuzhouense]|uniref:Uncharacterized protein n=1 Tax=Rhizobium wuzhouense TaxID=1986026 RepID=A0ABX5NU80_9HYPH|nr:hypothetical protein DMY87_09105 [Rhizobium wuzhouense]